MKKSIMCLVTILVAYNAQIVAYSVTQTKPTTAAKPTSVLTKDQVTIRNKSNSYTLEVEMPLPSTVKRSTITHGYTVFLKPGQMEAGLKLPVGQMMYVTATNNYTGKKSIEYPLMRSSTDHVVIELDVANPLNPHLTAFPLTKQEAQARGYTVSYK